MVQPKKEVGGKWWYRSCWKKMKWHVQMEWKCERMWATQLKGNYTAEVGNAITRHNGTTGNPGKKNMEIIWAGEFLGAVV